MLRINGGALTNYEDLQNMGTLTNNYGTLINGNATTNGGTLNNNGVIDNSDNKLGSKGFINKGTYTGTGKIIRSWTDHGTVKPGNSAGGMLVDGNCYKKGGSKEI